MAPRSAVARAVEVDALVELGRYDEADNAAAAMLAVGSDLTTLSRVSYLAELHGELDVAVTAMRAATKSEGVAPENLAFAHVQLGNLLVSRGLHRLAEESDRAIELVPGLAQALAGRGRWRSPTAVLDEAIDRFQSVGRCRAAARIRDRPGRPCRLPPAAPTTQHEASTLAGAEDQLFEATGVTVDLDLALFEADPATRIARWRGQAAYRATPNVRAADCAGLGAAPARS